MIEFDKEKASLRAYEIYEICDRNYIKSLKIIDIVLATQGSEADIQYWNLIASLMRKFERKAKLKRILNEIFEY